MTATTVTPQAERRYRFSPVRILICGILLSILVAVCLYLYHTAFDFYHARILEKGSKTIAWFIEQVGFALPWIVICLFHSMVYRKHDRHDGICQREMYWEVVLVALLTYCVLLPYLSHLSDTMYATALEMGADIPQTDGKHDWTLLMKLHDWFVRLPIPLGILMLFHGARARREIRFPETEVAEPCITKAEYLAARAAAESSDRDGTTTTTAPTEVAEAGEATDSAEATASSGAVDSPLATETDPSNETEQEVTDRG